MARYRIGPSLHGWKLGVKIIFVVVMLGVSAGSYAQNREERYVSPAGTDSNSGTIARPFRNLERAREAVRSLERDLEVVVWVRDERYERISPLELTAEDSGSEEHPVVYRGYPGEEGRIVGGRVLTGLRQVSDETNLSRLTFEAREKIVEADLTALGVSDFNYRTTLRPQRLASFQFSSKKSAP